MEILVLDDELVIVRGLCFMVRSFHLPYCNLRDFTSSSAALESLDARGADLALVDINMPQMDGLTFISSARKVRPDCRFVILSGYSEFDYAQRAIRLGVRDYLIKPVDEERLRSLCGETFTELYHMDPEECMDFTQAQEILERRSRPVSNHLSRILEYIDGHLQEDVSASRLGQVEGLHPKYVSSLFLKEMNISLLRYVNAIRLLRAAQYLTDGSGRRMQDIALALGYGSERQFFRMFKRMTGMTPGQFRSSRREGGAREAAQHPNDEEE